MLAVSEAFNRSSPSTAQPLHRDDMAQHFDHVEGSGESSLLGLLVAGTVSLYPLDLSQYQLSHELTICQRCTFENGATQVIVGSYLRPEAATCGPADRAQCSTCEMDKGDAVFIIGSIWHGAGENKSDERRIIYSCHMTRGSYRADENQYIGIDTDVVRKYEPEVQALVGYSVSRPSCGHVDGKDPIVLLGSAEDPFKQGELLGQVITNGIEVGA